MNKIIAFMPRGRDMDVLSSCLSGDVGFLEDLTCPGTTPCREEVDFLLVDMPLLQRKCDSLQHGLDVLQTRFPGAAIIGMGPAEDMEDHRDFFATGITDYLAYPLNPEAIDLLFHGNRHGRFFPAAWDHPRDPFWQDSVRHVVETASPLMQEVFSKVRHVAPTGTTVLLTGETGTGKSLIARILHNHSLRKNRQFISVHCGAIPDTLTESELFGHEKGAFTGAVRRKPGKFELAHQGTIFLDEIGTISPCVQIKLLDVVQERVFQRVGGDGDIRTDVRIIAATNEDLRQLSARGLFRKDLYYRLNVFPIHVPPLRERQEDILRLTELFIKRCNIRLMKKIRGVHPQVARGFMRYDWPGNVRELENLIERACILEDGDILGPHRFPEECFHASSPAGSGGVDTSLPIATARRLVVDGFERAYLDRLLQECCGSVTRAAERAGITTRQLRKLMVRHHVDRKKYAHRAEALSVQRTGKENP